MNCIVDFISFPVASDEIYENVFGWVEFFVDLDAVEDGREVVELGVLNEGFDEERVGGRSGITSVS